MDTLNKPHEINYTELCCVSNFSFHRGASHPHELIERAAELGYRGLALSDECSLAGAVRALQASEDHGLPLILGSRFILAEGTTLVVLVRNRDGYTRLCRLITRGRRNARKGDYRLTQDDLLEPNALDDCWLLVLPDYGRPPDAALNALLGRLAAAYPRRTRLALALHRGPHDALHVKRLNRLRLHYGLPLVAVGDVHMHRRSRRALQDVFTALRLGTTIAEAGRALAANGERHLRSLTTLAALYPASALAETRRIAESCTFSLREIRYDYPAELVPGG